MDIFLNEALLICYCREVNEPTLLIRQLQPTFTTTELQQTCPSDGPVESSIFTCFTPHLCWETHHLFQIKDQIANIYGGFLLDGNMSGIIKASDENPPMIEIEDMAHEVFLLPAVAWQGPDDFKEPSSSGRSTPISIASGATTSVNSPPISPVSSIASRMTFADPILVGDVPYDRGEIRVMSDTLQQARRTGEFPSSRLHRDTFDAKTIIQDYGLLTQLRDVRGNIMQSPTEDYNALRAAVTQQIVAREAEHNDTALEVVAERRVKTFLTGLEYEKQAYLDQREITVNQRNNSGMADSMMASDAMGIEQWMGRGREELAEEVFSIVENAMMDTTGPLRLNISRMGSQIDTVGNHIDTVGHHIGALSTQVGAINSQVVALSGILSSQADTLNTSLTTTTTNLNTAIAQIPDIVKKSLQPMVQQAVNAAVESYFKALFGAQAPTIENEAPNLVTDEILESEATATEVAAWAQDRSKEERRITAATRDAITSKWLKRLRM